MKAVFFDVREITIQAGGGEGADGFRWINLTFHDDVGPNEITLHMPSGERLFDVVLTERAEKAARVHFTDATQEPEDGQCQQDPTNSKS